MKFTRQSISDVILIEPKIYGDNRGFFFESFNSEEFENAVGFSPNFVQDNHSKSTKNILRGLHYQLDPMSQGKLVRVIKGKVYDVAVDLRSDSSTYGQWLGCTLSEENKKQLWIPEGFAHGFYTLSNTAEFVYKTTNYYSPEYERCILWNDKDLGINWGCYKAPKLSEKDLKGTTLKEAEVF